ncbi:MAG: histidine kinase dimerization/phospho-acceptor domain-containing protein, partial [Burkholderiaceae bacterium]
MFRLSKTYAWISLASIALVAIVLSAVVRHFAVANLMTMGQRDTVALTRAFANSLGPQWLGWLDEAAELRADELRSHARTRALLEVTKRHMHGTDVAKIKIYAPSGRTVFSTELEQIGQDKSANPGFAAARAGSVATELTHRDKFSAFEQVVENRNLLSAYVPIRDSGSAQVRVVFELYSDVTELVQDVARTQAWVTGAVAGVLSLLYGLLFLVVRFADRLIRSQYAQLQLGSQALLAARDELEVRVRERTAQLEHTNAGLAAAWNTAQRASQVKAKFLAGIGHALREPLSALIGSAKRLSTSPLDASQRRHMDHIHSSGEALRSAIEQVLLRSMTHADFQGGAGQQPAAAPTA